MTVMMPLYLPFSGMKHHPARSLPPPQPFRLVNATTAAPPNRNLYRSSAWISIVLGFPRSPESVYFLRKIGNVFTVSMGLFTLVAGGNDSRRGFLNGRTEIEWHELFVYILGIPLPLALGRHEHRHPHTDQRRVEKALSLSSLVRLFVLLSLCEQLIHSALRLFSPLLCSPHFVCHLPNSPRLFACFLHL